MKKFIIGLMLSVVSVCVQADTKKFGDWVASRYGEGSGMVITSIGSAALVYQVDISKDSKQFGITVEQSCDWPLDMPRGVVVTVAGMKRAMMELCNQESNLVTLAFYEQRDIDEVYTAFMRKNVVDVFTRDVSTKGFLDAQNYILNSDAVNRAKGN